jgi:hypothetical protein
VFVSVNSDRTLDPRRRDVKRSVLDRLTGEGFAPQVFFENGLPQDLSWSFDNVNNVIRRCVGAVVLGFPRWRVTPESGRPVKLVGEYSHLEGAVALVHRLPTLVAAEDGIEDRGIVYRGGGRLIVPIPQDATPANLFSGEFAKAFDRWLVDVRDRRDLFLGYCSKSAGTAAQVQLLVERAGATVDNWAMDFRAGASILEQLERARDECSRGIFIFSEDDPLEGLPGQAAPRDNVVLEAGFFIGSKGAKNCLIIRVGAAKMPADLGGAIYLALERNEDVMHLQGRLTQFVETSLE